MKANELMIGDWVIPHYEDIGDTPEQLSVELFKYKDTESFIEGCDPIPLTPEILEKNGFVKDGDQHNGGFYLYYGENSVSHRTYDNDAAPEEYTLFDKMYNPHPVDEWYFERGIDFNMYFNGSMIQYVHQLQHALRLCGLNELADNFKV